jgi:hypothetical protein
MLADMWIHASISQKTTGIIVSSYLNNYLQIVRTIEKEEGSLKQSPHNDTRS